MQAHCVGAMTARSRAGRHQRGSKAWELEQGRRAWRAPVRGGVLTKDSELRLPSAEQGVGLVYTFEPLPAKPLRDGRLQRALESYAVTVPGFCY
jgi:hypothetical protein